VTAAALSAATCSAAASYAVAFTTLPGLSPPRLKMAAR
jgi:hypothetical protein